MNWIGQSLSLVASIALALAPAAPTHAQQADLPPDIRDALLDLSDVLADMADVTRVATDLPGAVIDGIGSDAALLTEFVGTGIAYAPYTGVLRGAEATLRSGAGNSYDQSLALITLLRRVGYDSQILVGPDPGAGPFSTTRRALPLPDRSEEIAELEEEIGFILEDLQALDPTVEADPLPQPDLPVIDPGLPAEAATAAMQLMPDAAPTPVAEDAGLYAMVRYRATPAAEWTYADPARARTGFALDATDYEILNAEIPDAHLHRVSLTVTVASEAFGTSPVARLDVPAQSLASRPVNVGLAPSGTVFSASAVAPFAPGQDLVFVSDSLPQSLVTLEGLVMPLEEAASGMGGVFRTGAGLMGDALSSLESGEASAAPLLDSITLEITTRAPDGAILQTARRSLLDRAAVAAELAARDQPVTNDLLRSAMLSMASGNVLLYSGVSSTSLAERTALAYQGLSLVVAGLLENVESARTAQAAKDLADRLAHDRLALFFDTPGTAPHVTPSVALVRSLVSDASDLGDVETQALMTDIVIDGRRSATPEAALRLAVDAAGQERIALAQIAAAGGFEILGNGSHAALQTAVSSDVGPLTGAAFLASQASRNDLPISAEAEAQRAYIAGVVEAGKSVVVWPAASVDATVWLEYEPKTGSARLASGLGAGQDLTEDQLIKLNVALVLANMAMVACISVAMTDKASSAMKCAGCALGGLSVAMLGLATGGLGGAVATAAVGDIFKRVCS